MTGINAETTARFETLCETYGGNLNLWPADERAWADAALRAEPALHEKLEEAGTLDAILDEAPAAPRLGAETIGAILAAAPQKKRGFVFWPFGSIWRPAAGLVTAMALGISVGAIYPSAASLSTSLTAGYEAPANGDYAIPADLADPADDVSLGGFD